MFFQYLPDVYIGEGVKDDESFKYRLVKNIFRRVKVREDLEKHIASFETYQLQDDGLDTVEANEKLGFGPDLREYGIGAQILKSCGVRKMRLLTNNPRKIVGLEGYHLEVVGREPIEIPANKKNSKYLKTKRDKLGHFILGEEEAVE